MIIKEMFRGGAWETQGDAQRLARGGMPQKATLLKEGQGDGGVGPNWQATTISRPSSQHVSGTQL